ncbi:MAG: GNAT family N-acetyltransferase [candidate division Zixibacteria bacterium]|nr:GNAT family N-acetyltransferase [candidate division Zixibacteria bacterium]
MGSYLILRITKLKLKGERIVIRPLKRNDIDKRLAWQEYPDPLYAHYNLKDITQAQKREWYKKRKKDPKMLYLAIDDLKGELLGFLNLYDIDWENKKARLGIYLGYEYTGKGHGTESIKNFLPYYFERMKFRELGLDVASFNLRAIRCYLKCGFKLAGTKFNKHDPRSKIDIFGDEKYKDIRKYFKKEGNEILVQFEEMRMTDEIWYKNRTLL